MQDSYKEISTNVIKALTNHFQKRIKGIVLSDGTDVPYIMFKIDFTLYDYFNIMFTYDKGRFGASIANGTRFISLKFTKKWYEECNIDDICKELDEQIRIRIPDKFLEANNWN